MLDEADLPTGAVADQLCNTRDVAEKHYIARRVANPAAADALEGMVDSIVCDASVDAQQSPGHRPGRMLPRLDSNQ